MEIMRRCKKSAIGASSVTLVPDDSHENHPADLVVSQIVVSTNAVTPPPSFWGTAVADGRKYRVTIAIET